MQEITVPHDLPSLETIKEQTKDYKEIDALSIFTLNTLLQTSREVQVELERGLADHDLSLGRHVTLWCVAVLGGEEGIMPAEIASQLGVTRATVTGLLDSLEKDKLIVRSRRVDDRRKVDVMLTAKGVKLIETVWPIHYGQITVGMSGLNKQEKNQLITLLTKIRHQSSLFSKPLSENPVASTKKQKQRNVG